MDKFFFQKDKNSFLTQNPYLANIYRPPTYLHSHDYYEISFCIKNGCNCVINDKTYSFSHGTCTLIRPTDTHAYKNIPKCKFGEYQHADVYVTVDKMKKICDFLSATLFEELNSEEQPIVFSLPSSQIKTIIQQMNLLLSANNTPICDSIHTVIVTILLARYMEEAFFYSSKDSQPEWIKNLLIKLSSLDYMLLTVPQIATDIGYSPEYLSREFHKYTGITLKKYIIQKKMEYASTIMAVNDIKIIDLAQILGYSNPSNFSKNFQDVFNCTPIQYQREILSHAPLHKPKDE